MSEMQQLQKQIQQSDQQDEQHHKKREDVLDQDEVMVDNMQQERSLDSSRTSLEVPDMEGNLLDSLQLNPELFHDLEKEDKPPMLDAIHLASQFMDAGLVFRALADGDPLAFQELKDEILGMMEDGIKPQSFSLLERFSDALGRGIIGLDSGAGETELQGYEVENLKGIVDSSLLASEAMHSEVWEANGETILAFQNLTESEADEVQEDLSEMDDETISSQDREKILDPEITAIEVEEVLVDAWEIHLEEEYEVVEEEDVD